MKMTNDILKKLIRYNKSTGKFFWKERLCNKTGRKVRSPKRSVNAFLGMVLEQIESETTVGCHDQDSTISA